MKKIVFIAFYFACFIGCYYDIESELYDAPACDPSAPTYNSRIKVIMEQHCTGCHSGSNPLQGIDLSTYANVKSSDNAGIWLCSIKQLDQCSAMPKGGKLSDCDIKACENWVANGYPEN